MFNINMKLFPQGLLLLVIFGETIKGDFDSRFQKCDKPNLINGKVRLTKRGRIARFKCNPTFQLLGEKYATCLRGQWDTNPTCIKSGCVTLPTFNNGQKIDTYRGAVVKFICNPGYSMIGSPQIFCDGSIWNGSIPQCTANPRSSPMMCDFESPYICGWSQDPFHTFNWSRQNYQTPSRNIGTGPSFDHTLGPDKGGYYMFIETSSPRIENDTARLFSPVFSPELTVSQPSCFIFWYHMYGAATGILNIYVKPEDTTFDGTLSPKFTKSGNQGDEWFQGVLQLPRMNMTFQIIVEALRGSSYVSDIAIDDVKVTNGSECIEAVKVTTTAEPPLQNTSSWTSLSSSPSRTVKPGGTNFTFPTPPPLPPLPPFPSPEPFTETDKDREDLEFLTSPVPTGTSNTPQVIFMTIHHTQHQLEVYSTTEELKRIPIPTDPTPLILEPRTDIIKKVTERPTTPAASKIMTPMSLTTNTVAVDMTTLAQNITIPTMTTTLPKKTTIKPKTKFVTTTVKPAFIPIQRMTSKRSTSTSTTTTTSATTTTKQTTRKALTTPTTVKIEPHIPLVFPEFPTTAIPTQEPIQEKIITVDVKVEPHLTTEKADVTANSGKVTRGKKWIEARRGPVPERKNTLSFSNIVGILVAVTLVIAAVTIAAYFYVRHRRQTHRQSCISDDSDVRFLTSDEVLDFSLARPNDSGDDDL